MCNMSRVKTSGEPSWKFLPCALTHCIRNGALSQATTSKNPSFLLGATSRGSSTKHTSTYGWRHSKIAGGVMRGIRQNQDIRNMQTQK